MAVTRWLARPWIDLMFKAAIVLSLVIGCWATYGQWQLTHCQARYAEASNRSTAARAQAATEDREALDDLINSIVKEPERGLDALKQYQSIRASADRRRALNPVPPSPETTCG